MWAHQLGVVGWMVRFWGEMQLMKGKGKRNLALCYEKTNESWNQLIIVESSVRWPPRAERLGALYWTVMSSHEHATGAKGTHCLILNRGLNEKQHEEFVRKSEGCRQRSKG
jgi:hypothetical protein